MQLSRGRAFDEPVNWKIMHDAFLDGYHIKFADPTTANSVVHTNIDVIEDHGRHARFASPRKSLDAWLDRDPLPDEPMAEHVMLSHFIGPNNTLLQLGDNYQLLSFYPTDDNPAWLRMEMRLMVPTLETSGETEAEWTARWEKNWHILQMVLAEEDFPILRGIQRAYSTADRQPDAERLLREFEFTGTAVSGSIRVTRTCRSPSGPRRSSRSARGGDQLATSAWHASSQCSIASGVVAEWRRQST
jgi:hypothetical protein